MAIACGYAHSLFIDPNGTVWTSGRNDDGQLGHGHLQHQLSFTPIKGIPCAIQVSASEDRSTILDHEGDLWIFGRIDYSRTDQFDPALQSLHWSPRKMLNLPKISMVSCGSRHSIVLDHTGYIWGIGDNYYGQISIEAKSINTFTRINTPEMMRRVTNICSGSWYTIVQSETGELWGTGFNKNGQLGVGHSENVSTFTKILLKDSCKVQSFDCGENHTIVLDIKGRVWASGAENYGESHIGSFRKVKNRFTKMTNIPPIVVLMCGIYSTIMMDINGKKYCFGQLGISVEEYYVIPSSKAVLNLPLISQGCMSGTFTLLVDDEGGLWVSGDNTYGQLGTGNNTDVENFLKVDGVRVNINTNAKRFRNTKSAKQ